MKTKTQNATFDTYRGFISHFFPASEPTVVKPSKSRVRMKVEGRAMARHHLAELRRSISGS